MLATIFICDTCMRQRWVIETHSLADRKNLTALIEGVAGCAAAIACAFGVTGIGKMLRRQWLRAAEGLFACSLFLLWEDQ